jgi:RNA polymerase sigma-70 factor, ECF subfamily
VDGEAQERVLRLPLVWNREEAAREEEMPHAADPASDEDLVVRVCAGDKEALALLFDRFAQSLFRVAYRVLGDRGEAEEVVQDVFLHLFIKKSITFDPSKGAARPWLVQVACRRALDRRTYLLRRGFWSGTELDPLAESLSGGPNLEAALETNSDRAQLERALDELPERQRTTLQSYFFEGMELKEISEETGESFGNVRHAYYRGLERLRKSTFVQQLRDRLK